MKTINYTGNSKLITRIVHLLNRKAPLPLDGQGDADWGTSGQVLTTDGQGNTSWTTPQGGGGDVTDVEVNGTSVVNAQGVAEVSVPTATSDLNNDSGFIDGTDLATALSDYTPTASLATVATSGDYDDLTNKPTIPAAQVNSDWNAVSGVEQILNKPTLATVATSGSYNDLTNKPTIPTVNDGTLTIQQNGTTLGTFTANQSGNTTVNLTGGGHTIWNRIKTALTSRAVLWFADASVSDDSTDGATKVEVVTELQSESDFDNLATDGTADGIYTFPDSGGEYLTAEMVGYGNTDVKTALDGKVSKSGDTISGNLNVTGNLQKNGTNVLLAGGAVTRTLLWEDFETQCNPGSSVANPLVTYSALSQYDEIHIEVGVGTSGDSKQTGSEIISKEMLSIMNTYGSVVYHTTNAAGISNNTFYKTGFFVQLSGGSLILGNHTQGYAYNYMRIRVEGIKYN